MRLRQSLKAARFTESVIREMTRLANRHGAVNLAQGFPDFPCPEEVKEAARRAITRDVNQYAITWGAKGLRDAIARRTKRHNGIEVDPETMVTVACGSTEAMIASLLATVDPGDEVVVFEPFYENYGPDAILCGAVPRFVRLDPPDWRLDPDRLRRAFGPKTRAIILNTPNNPTGKVFSREDLGRIRDLCLQWDSIAITDEIYEYILYDPHEHVSLATLDGMADRTVTISAASKTFAVTGWRVGWAIAAPPITAAIRKVHDFLTVGAPAPLQEGIAAALDLPDAYFASLRADYARRRDLLCAELERAGFRTFRPDGAYYVMADHTPFGFDDDVAFARALVERGGVAVVPGSSFYSDAADGRRLVRFCFPKKDETLLRAGELLRGLPDRLGGAGGVPGAAVPRPRNTG